MSRFVLRLITVFSLVTIFISGGALAQADRAEQPGSAGQGTVYLVQIGDFPKETADKLGVYIQERFKLPVVRLSRISLTKQMIDYARRQVPAQEIFDVLEPKRLQLLKNSKGMIIGLTTYDMYIRGVDWEFAFAAREAPSLAAVSSWRMDVLNEGQRANDELLLARLKKMVARTVGATLLGLEDSADPKSGMFGSIRTVADLDAMGEQF